MVKRLKAPNWPLAARSECSFVFTISLGSKTNLWSIIPKMTTGQGFGLNGQHRRVTVDLSEAWPQSIETTWPLVTRERERLESSVGFRPRFLSRTVVNLRRFQSISKKRSSSFECKHTINLTSPKTSSARNQDHHRPHHLPALFSWLWSSSA